MSNPYFIPGGSNATAGGQRALGRIVLPSGAAYWVLMGSSSTASGPSGIATASPYDDLLSALVAYLLSTPSVTDLITPGFGQSGFGQLGFGGTPQVYDEIAAPEGSCPYLVICDYTDEEPGETMEDSFISGHIYVYANDMDTTRDIAEAVKAAVDSPAINVHSLARQRFTWTTGSETGHVRNKSKPRRLRGIGKGGQYVYAEDIAYQFRVNPNL